MNATAYYDQISPESVTSTGANPYYPELNGIDCSFQSKTKSATTGAFTYTMILGTAANLSKIVAMNISLDCADHSVIQVLTYDSNNTLIETLNPMSDSEGKREKYLVSVNYASPNYGAPVYTHYTNLIFTPVSATKIKKVALKYSLNAQSDVFTAEVGMVRLYQSAYTFNDNWTIGRDYGERIYRDISRLGNGVPTVRFGYKIFEMNSVVRTSNQTQIDVMTCKLPISEICFMPEGETGVLHYGIFSASSTLLSESIMDISFTFSEVNS